MQFDAYADSYTEALEVGLSLSGEGQAFYARGRVRWLRRCLDQLGSNEPKSLLDFGCGTGATTPIFFAELPIQSFVGVDVSQDSLRVAREGAGTRDATYVHLDEFVGDASIDLAYTNGVFHHIPVEERAAAARVVAGALRPGGLFAFWENNPWNPGTRLIMSRVAFDRDAVMLNVGESRRLLRLAGFEVVHTTSTFYFPRGLRWLRSLEPALGPLPLGGQYMVLARKR